MGREYEELMRGLFREACPEAEERLENLDPIKRDVAEVARWAFEAGYWVGRKQIKEEQIKIDAALAAKHCKGCPHEEGCALLPDECSQEEAE